MSPEGARLTASAHAVFEFLDAQHLDASMAASVDELRRFVFGELGIPIGTAPPSVPRDRGQQ